jgi:hypothetical protein
MPENDFLSDLDKKIIEGLKLGAFHDSVSQHFLNLYHRGIRDSLITNHIEEQYRKTARKLAFADCPFRVPELHEGDYTFGFDIYGRPIRSYVQYLNAGELDIANTGAGKTNLTKYHVVQIIPRVGGCFLCDMRKKEFRSLRPVLAKMGIDLKIIRGRKFKLNPLQVPYAVEPVAYAGFASDFLVKTLNLPARASTLLRSTIIKLYIQSGVLHGGEEYPTLFHLYAAIKADRNANPQAKQAVLDNLEVVLLSLGPDVLAYHKGWSVHELAKQYLGIELTELMDMDKDLILSYLLTAEFSSRIAQGISNPNMDLYVAFDEGQRIFSQHKESASHEGNALIDLMGLVRGAGVGVRVSVLNTHNLSTTLPSLTSTKIIGRCGSTSDYSAAGSFVALTKEQTDWAAHHMQPGMFIGQISEGNFRYPFLFRVPLLESLTQTPVSDEEADNSIKNILASKVRPALGA